MPTGASATGWTVTVTHPESGRVIRPDAINPDQVQFVPGPNTMPRIRMPVRRAPSWLDEGFDDNPAMDVHLDGEQLPIDELVDVEQEEGQTILVGEGGAELRTTVQAEYEAAERPTAATDLVSNNTSYNVVDNTATPVPDTNTVQSPSGETELLNALSPPDDLPVIGTNGGIKPAQTCWTLEAENNDRGTAQTDASLSTFSNGAGLVFVTNTEDAEWDFTTNHTIPGGNVSVYVRVAATTNAPELTLTLNGYSWTPVPSGLGIAETGWFDLASDPFGTGASYAGGDLSGSETLRIVAGTDGDIDIDVVAPLDNRYSYTFDNSVNTADGYLDGPETHPTLEAVFDAYESAFSIVGGAATATINDTSNDQALALSNDRGQTYPISASNSASVTGSFPNPGATLNLKATLSRYSPNGAQDATPRFGYDAQRLDAYTLDADIEFRSLLIDESFDDSLASILNQILGSQYGWAISVENGTTTFTVDEPGSTVADRDPEISEANIQKRVQTYAAVTIKGSTIPVSGEQFQASSSFVNLDEDDILTGSEAVYDSGGTNYTRGVDYQMDYQNGEIRALAGGNLTAGNTYTVDYRHQIQATYNVPNQTGDTLTRTIPGVVSDRQAEQIAYVLAEVYPGVSTPRYEGQIVVPRLDVTFDPLEGLQLEDMDLPDVATPLSIRGEPQLTPRGLSLRLGSAPRLEESLSNISNQVSSLSDRS